MTEWRTNPTYLLTWTGPLDAARRVDRQPAFCRTLRTARARGDAPPVEHRRRHGTVSHDSVSTFTYLPACLLTVQVHLLTHLPAHSLAFVTYLLKVLGMWVHMSPFAITALHWGWDKIHDLCFTCKDTTQLWNPNPTPTPTPNSTPSSTPNPNPNPNPTLTLSLTRTPPSCGSHSRLRRWWCTSRGTRRVSTTRA